MFKKISFFLAAIFIAASLLTACQPNNDTSGVSTTDLMSVLNTKSEAITKKPGWLHVVENVVYDIDKENLGTLPNNSVIPLQYVTDTWYHISEQHQVYEYVQVQSTASGDVVQVSVFLDKVITNLMTNYVMPMNPYSLGALDYRFSNEMADFTSRTSGKPKLELTTVDGRKAAVFTIQETLSEPTSTENYTQQVYGVRTVASYDTDSGLLFRLDRIRIFKDGSERTFYRTDITVDQNGIPPQDILDYLNRIN